MLRMEENVQPHSVAEARIVNVLKEIVDWHRRAYGHAPTRQDELAYRALATRALCADDTYLIARTAQNRTPDELRVKVAKMRMRLEEGRVAGKALRSKMQQRAEELNRREAAATAKLDEAKLLTEQASGWQRAAEEYQRQLGIARQQLVDNEIEPDRRIV